MFWLGFTCGLGVAAITGAFAMMKYMSDRIAATEQGNG